MAISKEILDRFCMAMFRIVTAMKKGMKDCCEKFGDLSVKEFMILNFVNDMQNCKMSENQKHTAITNFAEWVIRRR